MDSLPWAVIGITRIFTCEVVMYFSSSYCDSRLINSAERKVINNFEDVAVVPSCWPDYRLGLFAAFGMKVEWPEAECSDLRDNGYMSLDEVLGMEPPVPERDCPWPWYLKTSRDFEVRKSSFPTGETMSRIHLLHERGISSAMMGITMLFVMHNKMRFSVPRVQLVKSTRLRFKGLDSFK